MAGRARDSGQPSVQILSASWVPVTTRLADMLTAGLPGVEVRTVDVDTGAHDVTIVTLPTVVVSVRGTVRRRFTGATQPGDIIAYVQRLSRQG